MVSYELNATSPLNIHFVFFNSLLKSSIPASIVLKNLASCLLHGTLNSFRFCFKIAIFISHNIH